MLLFFQFVCICHLAISLAWQLPIEIGVATPMPAFGGARPFLKFSCNAIHGHCLKYTMPLSRAGRGGGRVLEIIFKLLTIIHTMKWIDVWLLHISRFSILCWEISIKFRKNKTIKLWQPFSLLIFYFPEVISARFASTIHQIEYVYRYWNRFYWTHRHSALH